MRRTEARPPTASATAQETGPRAVEKKLVLSIDDVAGNNRETRETRERATPTPGGSPSRGSWALDRPRQAASQTPPPPHRARRIGVATECPVVRQISRARAPRARSLDAAARPETPPTAWQYLGDLDVVRDLLVLLDLAVPLGDFLGVNGFVRAHLAAWSARMLPRTSWKRGMS